MKKSMFQFVNELIALNDSFANLTNPLVAVLESTTDSMNQSVSPFKNSDKILLLCSPNVL